MKECEYDNGEFGKSSKGEGWSILNLAECIWLESPQFGSFARLEGTERFKDLGLNVHVLHEKQPACLYHAENKQEGFLVLFGECRVIVNDEERALKTWDYFHCPAGVNHLLVGGDNGPCALLMVGARGEDATLNYPVNEKARSYGGSAEKETPNPKEAYAKCERPVPIANPWLQYLKDHEARAKSSD